MPLTFPSLAYAGSGTWSAKPAPSTVPAGSMYFASDVGENGTLFQSNGTRWRALNGQAALKCLAAPTGNISNSETNVIQTVLPVGSWQTNDTLRIWLAGSKSGTTDAGNVTVRIGTTGTTADAAITGLAAFALMGPTGLTASAIFDIKLISSNSAQKLGTNTANTHGYQQGSGATAAAAATAIADASTNALYVSVNVASGGSTNTVAVQSAHVQLITP